MQAAGSFKIPQWDPRHSTSLIGRGHVPRIVRAESKLIFLTALKKYIQAIIERTPVLTGNTREQLSGVLARVEALIQEQYSDYPWRIDEGDIGPLDFDVSSSTVNRTPTARQYPGSRSAPISPDPGKVYKSGIWYRGARRMTRDEWREAASGQTRGDFDALYSVTGGGWMQNFYFEVRVHDTKNDYYPEVYETESVVAEVFREAISRIYPASSMKVLEIFTGGQTYA